MIKTENGYQFKELTAEQMESLRTIKPVRVIVPEEDVLKIRKILQLDITSLEYEAMPVSELTAIRNTVVRDLYKGLEPKTDERWDMSIRVSMITAVIDDLIWSKNRNEQFKVVN